MMLSLSLVIIIGNDGDVTRVQRNFIIVLWVKHFIIVTIFTDQGILLLFLFFMIFYKL